VASNKRRHFLFKWHHQKRMQFR